MRLLSDQELALSSVVSNCCLNRDRELRGSNGYQRDLGFDPIERRRLALERRGSATWLDLCCGAGKALREAAEIANREGWGDQLSIVGVDLVDPGARPGDRTSSSGGVIRFVQASIAEWTPDERFDLITCVHGLHYVGDKIGIAHRFAGCLREDGIFIANFDLHDIRIDGSVPTLRTVGHSVSEAGFTYDSRRKRLSAGRSARAAPPYRYLGADDEQGPNYTGQSAVASHYAA